MPPSSFPRTDSLSFASFIPVVAVGERVARWPPARRRAPGRKCPNASINSLSRPGVDDGLRRGATPLAAHGMNVPDADATVRRPSLRLTQTLTTSIHGTRSSSLSASTYNTTLFSIILISNCFTYLTLLFLPRKNFRPSIKEFWDQHSLSNSK
jgi:hypothetical protein